MLTLDCVCGVGTASGFKHRPKVFSHQEEVLARSGIRKKAEELIAVGEKLGKNMIVRGAVAARGAPDRLPCLLGIRVRCVCCVYAV